ncbi:MAG: hypothetical protein KCHDKBKB_02994 [Elusimicrobia bacterium]|nr:hypothetical protein [Elusimicrobiota bacterium]
MRRFTKKGESIGIWIAPSDFLDDCTDVIYNTRKRLLRFHFNDCFVEIECTITSFGKSSRILYAEEIPPAYKFAEQEHGTHNTLP